MVSGAGGMGPFGGKVRALESQEFQPQESPSALTVFSVVSFRRKMFWYSFRCQTAGAGTMH